MGTGLRSEGSKGGYGGKGTFANGGAGFVVCGRAVVCGVRKKKEV